MLFSPKFLFLLNFFHFKKEEDEDEEEGYRSKKHISGKHNRNAFMIRDELDKEEAIAKKYLEFLLTNQIKKKKLYSFWHLRSG